MADWPSVTLGDLSKCLQWYGQLTQRCWNLWLQGAVEAGGFELLRLTSCVLPGPLGVGKREDLGTQTG